MGRVAHRLDGEKELSGTHKVSGCVPYARQQAALTT
jgi:hypothetical protein